MDNSAKVIEVDINDVLPNRNQPRLILNEDDDLSLTDSVKQYGVLQPIIVRTIGDKYEIIAGERRYRASVLAGKETVPVIVKNMTDKESAEIALIENVQRKELTPIEEALSYKNILDLGYLTQEQLAEKIGKSQPAIANKIRLLNLSDEVQDALLENKISERHARSLLKLKNKKQQDKLLEKIINERLTVRKTDDEIEKMLSGNYDDTESEGSSLEIERKKGEIDMNNEVNNMPQFTSFVNPVSQTNTVAEPQTNIFGAPVEEPKVENTFEIPQFDIFANAQPAQEPTPVVEQPAQAAPQFNIFAEQPKVEQQVTAPVEPQVNVFNSPVEEPKVENTFEIPQFDIFANATANDTEGSNVGTTITPVTEPVKTEEPKVEPVPQFNIFAEQPAVEQQVTAPVEPQANVFNSLVEEPKVENTFEIPKFDIFANATANDTEGSNGGTTITPVIEPVETEEPKVEPVPQFNIFAEQPAVEQQVTAPVEPQVSVLDTAPVQDSVAPVEPEVKPEPIIVTDYNKQYDPVMPNVQPVAAEPVAFKEVISAIRECANKIESYGYKIDVDEFDLTNIYQAIFKIEKM